MRSACGCAELPRSSYPPTGALTLPMTPQRARCVTDVSKAELQALMEHLPLYSSKGRIGEAVESLRRVTSECDAIQSSFNAQKADMTTIVDKLQAQAALQSDAFDAVHVSREAAGQRCGTNRRLRLSSKPLSICWIRCRPTATYTRSPTWSTRFPHTNLFKAMLAGRSR